MKTETIIKFQNVAVIICRFLTRIFLRPKVSGIENLRALIDIQEKEEKGIIIVSNHINALDPFIISSMLPKRVREKIFPITFLGKKELFSSKYKDIIMRCLGCIPVRSGANIRETIGRIKSRCTIFIFPEGHVSKDGTFRKDSGGVQFFSKYCEFALMPVRICGIGPFRKDWRNILFFRKRLTITYGPPIEVKKNSQLDAVEVIRSIKIPERHMSTGSD